MRILFFGRYDPAYARNRVLFKGLRIRGAHIIECRVDPAASFWPIRLFFKYWSLIIGRWSFFDVMVVAFPGQEVMFLARLLTRKPVIFDAFTSHYEGYVLDRKTVRPGSLRAQWLRFLDRWSCRLANAVLLDTQAHINFFVREYGLNRKKFHRVFVGTDTDIFKVTCPEPVEGFTVHFHGTVIPLQGISYIQGAAAFLKNEDIVFNLIGVNRPRVPYDQLASVMVSAHVCLGIFGDTPKTQRVIPNKVFEALAVGRPVITADTSAIRELLDDHSAVLIPGANAQALADAIMKLKNDPELRLRLGRSGYDLFQRQATPDILGGQLLDLCKNLL